MSKTNKNAKTSKPQAQRSGKKAAKAKSTLNTAEVAVADQVLAACQAPEASVDETARAGRQGKAADADCVSLAEMDKQVKVEKKTAKKVSALDLAAQILKESRTGMHAKDICDLVIAAGWKTSGKTPAATLYSAMIREIAQKKEASRFCKTARGEFQYAGN